MRWNPLVERRPEDLAARWIYAHLLVPLASPPDASLLWSLGIVLSMYLLAYGMYRRRWFVRF